MRVLLGVTAALLLLAAEGRAGQSAAGNRPRPEPLRVDPLTASISGRITTADTGAPLRRAEVRAISERGLIRLATTDDQGRFVVRDLPAGTFSLHVSKTGFVPLYFGQRRPFERRAPIPLTEGQKASADVGLPRAGAITGRIFDTTGEPVMGARVQALRRRMVDGVRGLQSVGSGDTTDDTGAFRLYGLPPGDYYVTATPRRIEDRMGRLAPAIPGRGAPIFFPGTANRDEAQRITVDVSGEARADMQLHPVRTSRVTGVVLSSNGTPATGAMVSLLARDLDFVGGADGMFPLQIQGDADADGRFELEGVPPGSFVLRAQTRPQMPPFDPLTQRIAVPFTPTLESALVPVTVTGDVSGLTVTTSLGGTVDVLVVADQGASSPPPSNVRISVRMGDRNEMGTSHTGSQMALSLASASRVFVDGLPDNWALKAIFLDNEDVTDKPIEFRNGQNGTLRVVLTDRTSDVVGTVGASSSFASVAAGPQATVVVFADDERKWGYPSRFIRIARTSGRGTFRVPGLPPDETYRAIAVDYLEEGEESDPEFLQRMRERATRFSIREGEQQALDLRVIQR